MACKFKVGDRIRCTKPASETDAARYSAGWLGTVTRPTETEGTGAYVEFDNPLHGGSTGESYLFASEMELVSTPRREVRDWSDPEHDAEVLSLLEIGALYALVDESYSNGHDFGVMECVAWKDRQQLGGLFQSLKRKGLVFDGDNPLMIDGKEVTQYTLCEPLKAVIR